MVDNAIKRIRPADFELSQVQDNLGNALDGVLQAIKSGALRRTMQMGTFWVGSDSMPTTDVPMQRTISNRAGTSFQTMTAFEIMPVDGSILSVQGGANGYINATWFLTVYINSKATSLVGTTKGPRISQTAKQGQIKFSAGDSLAVFIRGDATINQSFSASIDVESQG